MNGLLAHPGRAAKHCDSVMLQWWKTEGIGEVEIQRDDAALIQLATCGDFLIGGGAKVLFRHGAGIMPGVRKQIPAPQAEIFIELEFHETGSRETGTKRSWDIAEP